MKKLITSLLISLFAVALSAQTWQISYPNPADVTATLVEDSILVICGTGDMQDFEYYEYPIYTNNAPWFNIRGAIKALVLNEGITNIYNCDSVKIPNENGSFLYTRGSILAMGGEYRVLLSRKGENYGIFTCPLIPEQECISSF